MTQTTLSKQDVKKLAQSLYDRHMQLATVGAILRDRYGVYSIRAQYGCKLKDVVDTRLNPAITPLLRKLVRMQEHLKTCRNKDHVVKRRVLCLTQTVNKRLRKLPAAKKLPLKWTLDKNDSLLGRYRLY